MNLSKSNQLSKTARCRGIPALCLLLSLFLLFPLLVSCSSTVSPPPEESAGTSAPSESETDAEPVDTVLTLVSQNATEYQIVRSDTAAQTVISAAVLLRDAIKECTGVQIPVVTDFEHPSLPGVAKAIDCEIIVGTTTRQGKYFEYDSSSLGTYDYVITAVGKRVLILGGSESATASAVSYFIAHYLPGETSAELTFPIDTLYEKTVEKTNVLTVMSQNLLATDTEYAANENNQYHLVSVRQDRIRQIILSHMPDSIGLQECSAPWRTYFDGLDPTWSYDRVGANKNEKVSILYNTDTLKLIRTASIWLTEEPETMKISVAQNATTERLAHYAIFEIKATGERYIHVNTHIGFDNPASSAAQSEIVRDYCEKLHASTGYPVVCTGDFNFDLTHTNYQIFTANEMQDTKILATESSTGTGSFNKMGAEGYPKSYPIDQIMVTKESFYVYTYQVDYTTFNGYYASDHYAVVATLQLIQKDT